MKNLRTKRTITSLLVMGGIGLSAFLGGGIAAAVAADSPATQTPPHDGEGLTAQPGTYDGGLLGLYKTSLKEADPDSSTYDMLERAVASGSIPAADYESAHQMYESCLLERGIAPAFRKTTTGLYVELPYTDVKDEKALDEAVMSCTANTAVIEALYSIQVSNPDTILDQRVVALQCLVEAGYVEPNYSVDQFEADMKTPDKLPFNSQETSANDCLYGAGYAIFDLTRG